MINIVSDAFLFCEQLNFFDHEKSLLIGAF